MGRPIERRVDLVELLPRTDHRAFFKKLLLNDAADLRPDFRDAHRRGAADKLGRKVGARRLDGNIAGLSGGLLALVGIVAAAGQQKQHEWARAKHHFAQQTTEKLEEGKPRLGCAFNAGEARRRWTRAW